MKENSSEFSTSENSKAQEYEIIDSRELARRWTLPESWVRGHVGVDNVDPIPHLRFGRYVRFRWSSPELNSWLGRRTIVGSNTKRAK